MYGHNVSHAKNRTYRVFRPNLRFARLKLNGIVARVRICVKCLKREKQKGNYMLPKIRPTVQPLVGPAPQAIEPVLKKKIVGKKKIVLPPAAPVS